MSTTDWTPELEFVPNNVTNTFVTKQAVAIGNGHSRVGFDLSLIANHKGGVLATDKLQSYGCNGLYRDFAPDFLVAVGSIVDEIAASDYVPANIVYTNATGVLKYPGKFQLIPQNIYIDAGALAAYMAAFDGHKKVFLIGYDQYDNDTGGNINTIYAGTDHYPSTDSSSNGEGLALSLSMVMKVYNDVEFVRVMPTATSWYHPKFGPLANFRQISYQDFVYEADIG
jgi:hypothetical protein